MNRGLISGRKYSCFVVSVWRRGEVEEVGVYVAAGRVCTHHGDCIDRG